ncbi:MAG: sodium:solute symporter [Acetobacter okinawensis]|uniref:sodium:solute symporter n=1 Tax=Acetobacter okinawensis TaxID=1076594 RepID=UPI0039E8354E
MSLTDLLVMLAYLAGMPVAALALAGRQSSPQTYLEGHADLPWWALSLSLVATETSTLTVISVPGIAYGSGMVFIGLALGYLLGRGIVAWWFVPLYQQGRMLSAYDWLGQRFGTSMQRLASATFLLTRLLAEAVRLFAGMLPLATMLAAMHWHVPQPILLGAIMLLTLFYTVCGGLRAVVWSDSMQFGLYLFGASACAALLWHGAPSGTWHALQQAGRLHLFAHNASVLNSPFTPLAALGGGALLCVASHGTDQLMVQRILAARSLRDARLALMGSVLGVGALFALLSLSGILLWARNGGQTLAQAGFASPDALFPAYIVHDLPPGLRGLMLAGILAATMGSLSATLSAMTAASVGDFAPLCARATRALGCSALGFARLVSVGWGCALVAGAGLFAHASQSAIMLGLSIAACGYGPMLGTFVAGMAIPRATARTLAPAFALSVPLLVWAMLAWHPNGQPLAFAWLIVLGIVALFGLAGLFHIMHFSHNALHNRNRRPHP